MNMINYISEKKVHIVTLVIFLLIIFSWTGRFYNYSEKYTNDAIIQAGSSYAIARGINAIISVLQSSTISAGVGLEGSISIGEVLDPLNDLIERFSQVMSVVLGSLVLQKILLAIAANKIFSGLLTLLGFVSVFTIYKEKTELFPIMLRLFILFVIVRFSLGTTILLNSTADHLFLSSQLEEKSENLDSFKTKMNNLQYKNDISLKELLKVQVIIHNDNTMLQNLRNKKIPELTDKLDGINKRLAEATLELKKMKKETSWYNLKKNPEVELASKKITTIEKNRDAIEKNIKEQEVLVQELTENISTREAQLTGDDVGLVAKFKSLKKNLAPSNIEAKVSSIANNIFELMVLFILKTIMIPLIFLYILINLAKCTWRMNWNQIVDCSTKQNKQ